MTPLPSRHSMMSLRRKYLACLPRFFPSNTMRYKRPRMPIPRCGARLRISRLISTWIRSEEHTSELQSRFDIVCRLLLEKKTIIIAVVGLLAVLPFGFNFLRDYTVLTG